MYPLIFGGKVKVTSLQPGNETGLGKSLLRLLFIKGPRGYVLSPSGSSGKQNG